jgi:hypothetical protein
MRRLLGLVATPLAAPVLAQENCGYRLSLAQSGFERGDQAPNAQLPSDRTPVTLSIDFPTDNLIVGTDTDEMDAPGIRRRVRQTCDAVIKSQSGTSVMRSTRLIAIDLAKNVFQVCVLSLDGAMVSNREIKRAKLLDYMRQFEACIVAMKACSSYHY